MAVATEPKVFTEPPPVVLRGPIYRWTSERYLRMANAGILDDERVELLEGVIVTKMGKKPPHVWSTSQALESLLGLVPVGWSVYQEAPIVTEDSVPEPDCSVLRGRKEEFKERLPQASEASLVVEVADTTLAKDQGEKKRIYARAGIPIYWIINLVSLWIEVYSDPTGPSDQPDYHKRRDYGPDDEIPVVIDGREVGRLAVRDLLP